MSNFARASAESMAVPSLPASRLGLVPLSRHRQGDEPVFPHADRSVRPKHRDPIPKGLGGRCKGTLKGCQSRRRK